MENDSYTIAPGLVIAMEAHNKICKDIIDAYNIKHFKRLDGSLNLETVVTFVTSIFENNGYIRRPGLQNVKGITVYPKEYFCPMDYITGRLKITSDTRTVHHYMASWHTEEEIYFEKLSKILSKLPWSNYYAKFLAAIKYRGLLSAIEDCIKWIKR